MKVVGLLIKLFSLVPILRAARRARGEPRSCGLTYFVRCQHGQFTLRSWNRADGRGN